MSETKEDKKKGKKLSKNCWANYTAVGVKVKNGKTVPNCVPKDAVKKDVTEEVVTKTLDLTKPTFFKSLIDATRFVASNGGERELKYRPTTTAEKKEVGMVHVFAVEKRQK